MRKQALVLAGLAAGLVALSGCANKQSGSMGATGGACCKEGAAQCEGEKAKGSMGAVSGEKAGCCTKEKAASGSMGAVSGSTCSSKSSCTK